MARQCKTCGGSYSLWSAQGDGLCTSCRKELQAEQAKKAEEEAKNAAVSATAKIRSLLDEVAPGEEWELAGLCTWSTLGHEASQTANLWIGRLFFGIGGDLTHTESSFLGVLGLSREGTLCFAKIGETVGEISPQNVLARKIWESTAVSVRLQDTYIQRSIAGALSLGLPGGKEFKLTFPECFLEDNDGIPEKLEVLARSAYEADS